jgi:hypothetical protein
MTAIVLDPVRHERLIKDIDHITRVANVPLEYLRRSMVGMCSEAEIDWVRNFKKYRQTHAGLAVVGHEDAESKCLAICGALLRNFVDARVMPLNSVLDLDPEDVVGPTVMIIPNFHQRSYGKTLPAWKVSELYDALLSRYSANKPTVLAFQSLAEMELSYGQAIADHVKKHYRVLDT